MSLIFQIFRLQSYVGGFAIVIIFFEVLYCLFTIFFFVRCIKKVRKEKCKYFKTFWDIMEFFMLCFGVACIAMYIFKHMLTEVAFHYLKKQSQRESLFFAFGCVRFNGRSTVFQLLLLVVVVEEVVVMIIAIIILVFCCCDDDGDDNGV